MRSGGVELLSHGGVYDHCHAQPTLSTHWHDDIEHILALL